MEENSACDRPACENASEAEKEAAEIALDIQEDERRNLFRNEASEAVLGSKSPDVGNPYQWDLRYIEKLGRHLGRHRLSVQQPELAALRLFFPLAVASQHPYTSTTSRKNNNGGNLEEPRYEWEILGELNGVPVSAFPDCGSDLDILSANFVAEHGLLINKATRHSIKLPNGKIIRSIGTVSSPFAFKDEKTTYDRDFHVLPRSIHDIVLGRSFLKATQTLTKFMHRLKKKVVACSGLWKRLRLTGSPRQRVGGYLHGQWIGACPDTGSDVMVMSRSYAKQREFHVERHTTCLEFLDGSFAYTDGVVRGVTWSWDGEDQSFECDFHVLDNLPCPVVLSSDFLFTQNAFSAYEESFYDELEPEDLELFPNGWAELCFIREARKEHRSPLQVLRGVFQNRRPQVQPLQGNRAEEWEDELHRQSEEEDRIVQLPAPERVAAWAEERRGRDQWLRDHPPLAYTGGHAVNPAVQQQIQGNNPRP
ncbi:hypothetical protein W97_07154 [Coniosporium apollinis CBS 100218]|uniref:Uncharacterized protein n=1 Tax=Coniosporium apollinis (strain CBS 100218) TaxID=1168221 RepID=R7Z1H8_CONA1|nr:uncharacterized protein W97_07154 [Coniosporium apollinis CBS 100218]EON68007.1 hypothetical protein W97_07154 [Coniosporium apollinis CBS 100218]